MSALMKSGEMQHRRRPINRYLAGALATSAGLIAAVTMAAAPAQADPGTDAFLNALTNAGVGSADPATAVALGQSICPMLSVPGQTAADVASKVADTMGTSIGSAGLFTGIAVSFFCPAMVSSLGAGTSPIPLGLLGI